VPRGCGKVVCQVPISSPEIDVQNMHSVILCLGISFVVFDDDDGQVRSGSRQTMLLKLKRTRTCKAPSPHNAHATEDKAMMKPHSPVRMCDPPAKPTSVLLQLLSGDMQ
jgi:hypothetical protein